ncbi:unnamed protein product, partial [Oppiella nova]
MSHILTFCIFSESFIVLFIFNHPLNDVLCADQPNGEDFYQLLGITRDADNRLIRKAFKQLALTTHPDKNPNDPKAHDNFLKITRAYEVLKDDEMRKKYDMYGEDGLKDEGTGRPQYHSWKYYNEDFGIY